MKVLLTSSNTLEFPTVQRGCAGKGSLQEGCCSEEPEIPLSALTLFPEEQADYQHSASCLWWYFWIPQPLVLPTHLTNGEKQALQWYRNVSVSIHVTQMSLSVLLPSPFLFPTLPDRVWLPLRSEVRHCSLENMGQEGGFADVPVLGQFLLGSTHILSSVCSLDCPSSDVCKTGDLE